MNSCCQQDATYAINDVWDAQSSGQPVKMPFAALHKHDIVRVRFRVGSLAGVEYHWVVFFQFVKLTRLVVAP